ncbi:MAG: hypothetical protein HEEMFOPI_00204 [Holosporales bacterium]
MKNRFGLGLNTIQKIRDVFVKYPEVKEVILYGSRAKGTYRSGSDIDLTLKGDVSLTLLLKIENDIDDLLLPYKVDLSIYEQIDNDLLKDHINRVGVDFFKHILNSDVT